MTTPSTHGGHVGESPPVTLKSGKTDRNSAGRADMIDLLITKLIVVSNYHHYGANYSIWCLSRMKLTHREFQRNLNAKKEHLVCGKMKQEINFFFIFLADKERTSTFSLIYMFGVWTESTSNIIRRSTWHERGRDASGFVPILSIKWVFLKVINSIVSLFDQNLILGQNYGNPMMTLCKT